MWHAIVIGSGIGGLAAAALGKRGKRVLLLEQHTVAGGQTQTFRRHDWVFATGVYYISSVGPHAGAEGQLRPPSLLVERWRAAIRAVCQSV